MFRGVPREQISQASLPVGIWLITPTARRSLRLVLGVRLPWTLKDS